MAPLRAMKDSASSRRSSAQRHTRRTGVGMKGPAVPLRPCGGAAAAFQASFARSRPHDDGEIIGRRFHAIMSLEIGEATRSSRSWPPWRDSPYAARTDTLRRQKTEIVTFLVT